MSSWTERNRWKRGRWLVVDDESGEVLYSDQVVRRWDGMYVRKDQDEPIDPQWFITSENDPAPLTDRAIGVKTEHVITAREDDWKSGRSGSVNAVPTIYIQP